MLLPNVPESWLDSIAYLGIFVIVMIVLREVFILAMTAVRGIIHSNERMVALIERLAGKPADREKEEES